MTVRRLTPEELARIKRKLVATSPGPWFYRRDTSIDDRDRGEIVGGVDQTVCAFGFDSPYSDAGQVPSKKDLDFICDAPEIVARLLVEIDVLEVEIEQLKLTLSARIKHE